MGDDGFPSYPRRFSEITGLDANDLFRAATPSWNTDRGIMMLALKCLSQGVLMTEEEQSRLREAFLRLENEHVDQGSE